MSDGRTRCWGNSLYGQLGDGTTSTRTTPVTVNGLVDAFAVSGGGFVTCALAADTSVACFGLNSKGQLGNGSTTNSSSPVKATALDSVMSLSVGATHTCAVRTDNSVYCWGDNTGFKLGTGTQASPTKPAPVTGISATSVAVGENHSCAVLTTGGVKCWGNTDFEQLGPSPGLSGVSAVATGYMHSCALRLDGSVSCWGNGTAGQLGDGSFSVRQAPISVAELTGAVAVSAGYAHTCAVRDDQRVACWGSNSFGQLGDGTTLTRTTPVPVAGISNAVAISAGYAHTCALLSDDSVQCWGWNAFGQLGIGSRQSSTRALTVPGLEQVNPAPAPLALATLSPTIDAEDAAAMAESASGAVAAAAGTCASCSVELASCGADPVCADCMDSPSTACAQNPLYSAVVGCLCESSTACAAVGTCIAPPPPPRLLAPISPNYQGPRPWLQWSRPAAIDGARVWVCQDRGCSQPVDSWIGTDSVQLDIDLPPGSYFWFAVGRRQLPDGRWLEGTVTTPTWQFVVDNSQSDKLVGFGNSPDYNGDGRADLAITNASETGGSTFQTASVSVYRTSADGSSLSRTKKIFCDSVSSGSVKNAQFATLWTHVGDVNGDGYTDAVTATDGGLIPSRVRLYRGGATGPTGSASDDLTIGATLSDRLLDIAAAGDVNHDGYADVVLWFRGYTPSGYHDQLLLLRGGPAGLSPPDPPVDLGSAPASTIQALGDVNGDGFTDVAVASGDFYAPWVQVFLGSSSGLPGAASYRFDDVMRVYAIGDVNDDGLSDTVMEKWVRFGASTVPGTAYLVLGAKVLALDPGRTITYPQYPPALTQCRGCTHNLQASLRSAGDVNGDGYGDVLLSGQILQSPKSRVYVYYGSASGIGSHAMRELYNSDDMTRIYDSRFGYSVAGVGDLDADGVDDIAISAADEGAPGVAGRIPPKVRVYLGTSIGPSVDEAWLLTSPQTTNLNDSFGVALSSLRD